MEPLKAEMDTYQANLPQLLGESRGKFVLIKGNQIIDTFANIDDALKAGYDAFGNEPFLVKQIVEFEIPQNFTSFQIGI